MKLAVYGAAGMVGSRITKEALERGHSVTALVRHTGKLGIQHPQVNEQAAEASDAADVAAKVTGHDVVISAISPRGDGGTQRYVQAAQALMAGCKQAGVKRLLWVGGAGSLEVAPGKILMDAPGFPAEYLTEARAGYDVLKLFRGEMELEWTYASPAALFAPGERRGKFKLGGDQLVVDAKGESRISVEDFAYAVVYQLEKHGKIRQRFTAAYVE
jgi:putative NADH-flavin reductase